MGNTEYIGREAMDQTERMYKESDREYQVTAVGYMYGVDKETAEGYMDELPEEKVADAMDYFSLRDMPNHIKEEAFDKLKAIRTEIQNVYGLSPVDAVIKSVEVQDFIQSVASIPVSEPGMEK